MRILRASDYKRMPWKNGGGETVEIAVSPGGAGLADFDWRVSMATVATDGPFSVFSGIDRTLSILEGAGMMLFIEGREPVLLTEGSDPLPFAADAPTSATLVDGEITDLNVMTRRGRLTHSVRRIGIDGGDELALGSETALVLCHRGHLDIGDRTLSAGDCLLVEDAAGARHSVSGVAQLFVIELHGV
ncbi:HutD family protein [Agrobacterium rhizogenes]|uniref:HutD-family protein n=1 Tax=Rhizobium rhizogenes (strain K84 / ATCC BAA-868) TaxID=311403 RepID=B9JDB8_RHIR8|nr:HutD family protein [Rhizobium rhizogenes]ACM28247.1 conserved hypothetical protein [Rhizobium rhizogenes K84]KAA6485328.1 HutD family protein [Agrobacterium sp. ICMP 7243]NTF50164.1 HutD family protein [Rhizobium rhizogenes]NTH07546.1 HutD family protein [Rhizobium rhizogenes]NTI88847.1 HutD family protein [Rhizobium rhizogenes]